MTVVQHLAPPLAARWAARLWCTLPRSGSHRLDARPAAGAETTVALPDGRSVVAQTWGPDEAAPVYLVHGWGGHRGHLGALVEPLVDAGYRVVAHDAPSHGASAPGHLGPGRSTAAELGDAVSAVTGRFGPPAGVVAHSLGAVAVVLAMADGLVVPRVAFIAPSVSPMASLEMFGTALGLTPATRTAMTHRLASLVDRPLSDFDALLDLPTPRPPALVVHDRDDRTAPYDEAVRMVHAWPDSELVTTEGLRHHRILTDPTVVTAVGDYLS